MKPYHVYAADISPYAQRVVLQLEIKGIDFTQEHPPGGFQSDEFGRINPIRKIPVLQIGDVNLPESQVICDYLEAVHPEPSLLPSDPLAQAHVRLIARIIDLYVMNPMMPLFQNLSRRNRDEAVVAKALAAIDTGLGNLDKWIAPTRYAIDDKLTLADLAAAPVLRYVAQYVPMFGNDAPFAAHANVAAYFAACRQDRHVDRGLSRIEAGWAEIQRAAQAAKKQ